jgi:hypothetical protein
VFFLLFFFLNVGFPVLTRRLADSADSMLDSKHVTDFSTDSALLNQVSFFLSSFFLVYFKKNLLKKGCVCLLCLWNVFFRYCCPFIEWVCRLFLIL